jgi:hypothetical protein
MANVGTEAIAAELDRAIRVVMGAWTTIPDAYRPEPPPWGALEREVSAAMESGNAERALAAVEAFEQTYGARFATILANCPFEPGGAR